MNPSKKILMQSVIGVTLVTLGIAIGVVANRYWQPTMTHHAMPETTIVASAADEPKVLYWYDPMYPQQHFEQPGKSPFMDMQLVPRYAAKNSVGSENPSTLAIDPRLTQQIGLREARVERITLSSQINTSGIVGFNQREVSIEQTRSAGFVKKVWPLVEGDVIDANQPLVELIVPEWTAAAEEFLLLRKTADAALQAAARTRLHLLGMPEAVINALEKTAQAPTHFVLRSSRAGVVQSFDVRNGMSIAAGQTVARINGIDSVWLEVSVPEIFATSVTVGSAAEMRFSALPSQLFNARVSTILPALAEASRSIRVRLELANTDHRLRPGMSAQVQLQISDNHTGLAIPTEAIIRTGKRALVMIVEEQGHFAPVEVTLGREVGDRTVIVAGLTEGQRVVASGQFLLDSEASLSGIVARPLPAPATRNPPAERIKSPAAERAKKPVDVLQKTGASP
jgi:Cu(I)/Ag(I) efflux system membrane fusion protein